MRNTSMRRVMAALLGLWFLLAGQEPPFAHPCHMARVGHSAAPTADAQHADAQHAHAQHAHAHHDSSPGDAPTDSAPAGTCECIGDCGAVLPMSVVPLATIALTADIAPEVRRFPLERDTARLPDAPTRRQPFAIGPPAHTHS